jgi:RNA polymerase sigma-70 factor (ECF subfamily)
MPPTEDTLARIHAEHAVGVYRFAWSITRDESLAQDVVQELFLKLARDLAPLTNAQSERAMLFTLTRNLALDVLRRRCREEKALDALHQQTPSWFQPADIESGEQLAHALAALPEEQRSVVHLHVWEDLSFREIAELLGAPLQTIASRYRYALDKLRQHQPALER